MLIENYSLNIWGLNEFQICLISLAIHIIHKFAYQEKPNTRQIPAILTFYVLFDHLKVAASLFYLSNSPILLQYMGFCQPFR